MKRKKSNRILIIILISVISLIIMSVTMLAIEESAELSLYETNVANELEALNEAIDDSDLKWGKSIEAYDRIMQAKADYMVYVSKKDPTYSVYKMEVYRELLNVDNLLIIDREGNVLAKAMPTQAVFTHNRFNSLKACMLSPGDYFNDSVRYKDGKEYVYYGAAIDSNTMFVIEESSDDREELVKEFSTWKNMLSNVFVGKTGSVMAISELDYSILYHSNSAYVKKDAISLGIKADELDDGQISIMKFDGRRYLSGVLYKDSAYVLCMVPLLEANNTALAISIYVILAFALILFLLASYAAILRTHEREKPEQKLQFKKIFKNHYFSISDAKQLGAIVVIGIIMIFAVYSYTQKLFSISQYSMLNELRLKTVSNDLKNKTDQADDGINFYDSMMYDRLVLTNYMVNAKGNILSLDEAKNLAKALNIDSLLIYNSKGEVISCNDDSLGYRLSENPIDQSYEFRHLLTQNTYYIQDPQPNDNGTYMQYAGQSLYERDNGIVGLVEIGMDATEKSHVMAGSNIDHLLSTLVSDQNSSAFAVDRNTYEILYFPDNKFIGKNAVECGLLKEGNYQNFSGYIDINEEKCFANSTEIGDYIIFVATPIDSFRYNYKIRAIQGTVISALLFIIVFLLLCIRGNDEESTHTLDRFGYTSAADRWREGELKWNQKTAEQQFFTLLSDIISIIALIVTIYVFVLSGMKLGDTNIISYILEGSWEKDVNIFSVTAILIAICIGTVINIVIKRTFTLLADSMTARGKTIFRMLRSASKYVIVLSVVFYTLTLLGAQPSALLASAGVLTAVIGLGAKSLTSDILAGFFLVFEGEFMVGDIVTINGFRGIVRDIGIRTTKIEDDFYNIKIIANSEMSGIVNMTKKNSLAEVLIATEYGDSLERIEAVLARELPLVKDRIPELHKAPYYDNVMELGDSAVVIRILAVCDEINRPRVVRALNRELKLIFDRNNINIPFPQVTVSQLEQTKDDNK